MEKHKIFNILSEYVGLFTEHAKRMRRIILLLCPVMKIGPVGAELFHPDGRTDRETDVIKLIVALRSLVRAPNIGAAASLRIGL